MAGKKILVADDNQKILDNLVKKLKDNNYEVLAFTNGIDAIENCRIFNPDLIILDIVMRDVDGYTVARTLREDRVSAGIPVIFVTSQELECGFIREKISEIGLCDFMNKACAFEELLAKIKEKIG